MKTWKFTTKQLVGFYLSGAVAGAGAWVVVERIRGGGSEAWPLLLVVFMLTLSGVLLAMAGSSGKGRRK
jgi:drug/metabolite transporter superfamily protein YnfA